MGKRIRSEALHFAFRYRVVETTSLSPVELARSARIIPGAIAATILWLVISMLFKLYVANFSDDEGAYGTVGGFIVLITVVLPIRHRDFDGRRVERRDRTCISLAVPNPTFGGDGGGDGAGCSDDGARSGSLLAVVDVAVGIVPARAKAGRPNGTIACSRWRPILRRIDRSESYVI